MSERPGATSYAEVDPNSSEVVTQEVIGPEGGRLFRPLGPGVSETASFRVTEHQMIDGSYPDSFSVKQNEAGDWVIASDDPHEEPWVLPKDTEVTIGIQGATMRRREQTNALPFDPATSSSPIPSRLAAQARDSGAGHPNLSFYTYDSQVEGRNAATLFIGNQSGDEVPLELHTRTDTSLGAETQEVDAGLIASLDTPHESTEPVPDLTPEESSDVKADVVDPSAYWQPPAHIADRVVTPGQVSLEQVEDSTDETGAADELTDTTEPFSGNSTAEGLAGGADIPEEPLVVIGEAEVESGEPVVEEIAEEEVDPLAGVPAQYRTAVRLGGMTVEEAILAGEKDAQETDDEQGEVERRERLVLTQQLELGEAVNQVAEYGTGLMEVADKAVDDALRDPENGLLESMKRAGKLGESINTSGVLPAVADLKRKLGDYSEDLGDLHRQLAEYLESGAHNRQLTRLLEDITGNKLEGSSTRDAMVDAMEELRDNLVSAKGANDGASEYLRKLESDLASVPMDRVNQPILTFNGVGDSVQEATRSAVNQGSEYVVNMVNYMTNERSVALQKVRNSLDTLRDLSKNVASQSQQA